MASSPNDSQLNLSNDNAHHAAIPKQCFNKNGKRKEINLQPVRPQTNFVCSNPTTSPFSLTLYVYILKRIPSRKKVKKTHTFWMSDYWAKVPMKMGEAIYRRFLINSHRVSVAKWLCVSSYKMHWSLPTTLSYTRSAVVHMCAWFFRRLSRHRNWRGSWADISITTLCSMNLSFALCSANAEHRPLKN